MILTCPACGTRYAVKEGAIPPGGRQVRCASCKHSWHQDPEVSGPEAMESADRTPEQGAPDADPLAAPQAYQADAPEGYPTDSSVTDHSHPDVPADAVTADADSDSHPLPEADAPEMTWQSEPSPLPEPEAEPPVMHEPMSAPEPETLLPSSQPAQAPEPAHASEQDYLPETQAASQGWAAADPRAEDDFPAYYSAEDEEPPRRRGLVGLLLALLLIAGLVAAFWFLAPPEWKQRLGVAQSGETPLVVQLDETNRRALASGNELLEVTGKVINPTDQPQRVPQIEAMLRSYEQKVVYRWTIPPPAPMLAPGGSATFNSAELLTVPADARCLSVTAIDGGAKQLEPCTPQSQQVATQAG